MKNFIVITTIRDHTPALEAFRRMPDWHLVIVGDRKTPPIVSGERCTFLSVADQKRLSYELLGSTPCYLQTRDLVRILENTRLEPGRNPENLIRIYEALSKSGIVADWELKGVRGWVEDGIRMRAVEGREQLPPFPALG